MKAMGLFGGVQVMGIICSIVRTKLVAIWIGPVGVGLFGLFNNALEMLNTGTNLGIRGSSVRDISQAMASDDRSLIARIIVVVRRWSLWLGLGGALLTLMLSPLLSQVTFGTQDHMWGFVALSVAVLLMAISNGEQAVLQGSRRLKRLARASVSGTLLGLLISIPLFYWLRERSVLPSIISYAACNALMIWLLRNREFPPARVSHSETVAMGRDFVKLGVYMTIGNFVTILASYVFNAWLNQEAGTAAVGHYQAGYTLINKYTGLILTALGMEYYPRLAQLADDPERVRQSVSQEVTVAMLVLAPVVAVFVLLRQPIVWLLYSGRRAHLRHHRGHQCHGGAGAKHPLLPLVGNHRAGGGLPDMVCGLHRHHCRGLLRALSSELVALQCGALVVGTGCGCGGGHGGRDRMVVAGTRCDCGQPGSECLTTR